MRKNFTLVFLLLGSLLKAQRPETDIFLVDMKSVNGKYVFAEPVNITNHPGYDNQPRFFPDGALYYVSFHDTLQSDIFRYDLSTRQTEQITSTKESEYSPTPIPGAPDEMSVVRVDMDSTQHLYRYTVKGEMKGLILKNNDTIGYHTWINAKNLVCFVLGKPNKLLWYNLDDNTHTFIMNNPGRCLLKVPNSTKISYVEKTDSSHWTINYFTYPALDIINLNTFTLAGSEDYAWTPDGKILMGKDGVLYVYDFKMKVGWQPVADFSKSIGNFYRIALDESGTHLALVGFKGRKP